MSCKLEVAVLCLAQGLAADPQVRRGPGHGEAWAERAAGEALEWWLACGGAPRWKGPVEASLLSSWQVRSGDLRVLGSETPGLFTEKFPEPMPFLPLGCWGGCSPFQIITNLFHFGFLNSLYEPVLLASLLRPSVTSRKTLSFLIGFRHLSAVTLSLIQIRTSVSHPVSSLSHPSLLRPDRWPAPGCSDQGDEECSFALLIMRPSLPSLAHPRAGEEEGGTAGERQGWCHWARCTWL